MQESRELVQRADDEDRRRPGIVSISPIVRARTDARLLHGMPPVQGSKWSLCLQTCACNACYLPSEPSCLEYTVIVPNRCPIVSHIFYCVVL